MRLLAQLQAQGGMNTALGQSMMMSPCLMSGQRTLVLRHSADFRLPSRSAASWGGSNTSRLLTMNSSAKTEPMAEALDTRSVWLRFRCAPSFARTGRASRTEAPHSACASSISIITTFQVLAKTGGMERSVQGPVGRLQVQGAAVMGGIFAALWSEDLELSKK